MITPQQAESEDFFHVEGHCNVSIGQRGRVKLDFILYRRNGAFREWKRTGKWRVPLKHGMYEYAEITEDNANEWHVESECEALKEAQYLRRLPISELVGLNRTGYAGVGN